MRLYLMRHGEAEFGPVDDERPLASEGRESAARTARALARLEPGLQRVLHSGKRRARETAEIVTASVNGAGLPQEIPGLGPDDDPECAAETLLAEPVTTLAVGHLPHLGRLASLLTTGDPDRAIVRLPAGTLIELSNEDGAWRLVAVLPPDVLERLGA